VTDRPRDAAADRAAQPSGRPPAVEAQRLSFAYPDGRQVLYDVSLTVAAGERLALLGPNGAGKTTLALHLNGILGTGSPGGGVGSGQVRIAGVPVERGTLAEVRRRVGIVFQDPDDQLFMPTVADDVAFGPQNLGLRGEALRARVAQALGAVGMGDQARRPPHHLSFGQRRRVALAGVLAMRPDVLVLDEPTANLDPASRRELAEILVGLEVAVVVITHDLPYALQLCPRSVIMDDGRVVADGRTRDLLADRRLMAMHRLELPYGFDPLSVPGPDPGVRPG
jgi:cobalt/nickel transport system ATP-binding protein